MAVTITNKYNLPKTIVDACKLDTHVMAGDISVTQLIDGPRIRILKKKHDYEEDVSEKLYALMGTALHNILERANMPEVRKRAFLLTAQTIFQEAEKIQDEKKATQLKAAANYIKQLVPVFFPEINSRYIFEKTLVQDYGKMILSGTFDLYDKETGILYDYKFCSVYAWIFPESRSKWMAQLNIYASMLIKEGFPVNGIRIVAFFRDWSEGGLMRNKNEYPASQLLEIPIELRPVEEIDAYISRRINMHVEAENGNIVDCTGKDRWAKSDQWAVMVPGQKKAHRLFDDERLANSFVDENSHKFNKPLFLQYRPGDSVRCEKYCPVSQFCEQRKAELLLREKNSK